MSGAIITVVNWLSTFSTQRFLMPTQQQLVVQHYSVRGPLTPVSRCPVSCCQVSRFQRPRHAPQRWIIGASSFIDDRKVSRKLNHHIIVTSFFLVHHPLEANIYSIIVRKLKILDQSLIYSYRLTSHRYRESITASSLDSLSILLSLEINFNRFCYNIFTIIILDYSEIYVFLLYWDNTPNGSNKLIALLSHHDHRMILAKATTRAP